MDADIRQGEAIGGPYAVTGTLPSLADVTAFTDGSARFDVGYYRFVSHPHLRRVESILKDTYRCRHCRLAESPEIALLELLLCLRAPGAPARVVVLKDTDASAPIADESFFAPGDREGLTVLVHGPSPSPAPELGRGDILILVPRTGSPVPRSLAEQARRASDAGASAILYGEFPPDRPTDVPGARYHVVGLRAEHPSGCPAVRAGAVLGSSDKVMSRLALLMRRRGPILSSRAAEWLLGGRGSTDGNGAGGGRGNPAGAVQRVADVLIEREAGTGAFLYASGMSAITRVLDVLRVPGKSQVVAVGYLFNDTYKGLQLAPRRAHEAPNRFLGVDEVGMLDDAVLDETAAILTETITNPLGDVPDLAELSRIARRHGVPLVVDNTMATPENCRPLELGADIVIHSTTKYLNGRNDHGGGAVIVRGSREAALLAERQARWSDGMSPLEAAVLEGNLATLPERMRRFNANAARVASMIAAHPGAGRLWFNGHPSHRSYATARRVLKGTGSVISFTLARDTREGLEAFYDSALAGIRKAPSLGSDATLLCPYTLLTHFEDTDEALAAAGLPRFLVRIAVGCEETIDPVLESLDDAFRRSLAGPA